MNLMLRVSLTLVDIESYEAKGTPVLLPVNSSIDTLHKPIVGSPEQSGRGPSSLVEPHPGSTHLGEPDKAIEVANLSDG